MSEMPDGLSLSPMDSERFGLPVLRLVIAPGGGRAEVRRMLHRLPPWRLLISRCEADDLAAAATLESMGARLMDVHVTFESTLKDHSGAISRPAGVARTVPGISETEPADADEVADLFMIAFGAYDGHYHADPRLDDQLCAALYADWARRLVRQEDGPSVSFVVRSPSGTIIGASILAYQPATAVAYGILDAVHPDARGRGLYSHLGVARMNRAAALGFERLKVSTHLQNLATCRNLARLGFVPRRAQLTFHTWND